MSKDYNQVPKYIFNKAISIHRMELRKRALMDQIDEWLESKGYDVESMRYHESFQVALEHGEFESEEELLETIRVG